MCVCEKWERGWKWTREPTNVVIAMSVFDSSSASPRTMSLIWSFSIRPYILKRIYDHMNGTQFSHLVDGR